MPKTIPKTTPKTTPKKPRKREPDQPLPAPIVLLIETARRQQGRHRHENLCINHWVTALHDLFPILPHDLAWDELKCFDVKSRLDEGHGGAPFSVMTLMRDATAIAIEANHAEPTIDDVALAILDHAGLLPEGHDCGANEPPLVPEPLFSDATPAIGPDRPMLARFGRDLTAEAAADVLNPVVGRKEQLALILETLCRQTKKNVALVGPAAVGKRAIVEALAQRIAAHTVPARLRGIRIIEVQLPALLAGVSALPELDERFCGILKEARDPNIVLFLDELRTITPAGHDGLTLAISNQLKPEIARGEVTCIISGAQDDYLRFVELDASLRPWFHTWFQPIRIEELSASRTLEALELIAAHTRKMTGVEVPPSVRKWIVDFGAELLKGHRFPGKAVDLFEASIGHAVSEGRKRVTLADARTVAERAIAIPADMESRLRRICKLLAESGVLMPADQETVLGRLSVTLRSLDLMPVRPNAILLLAGEAAVGARAVAESLADAIAGSPERVIPIDFGLLTEPWDTRQLLGIAGAGPQQQQPLALHSLIDAPWSVVLAENIDGCHAQVRASLTRALSEGYFTDAKGRKIYLSDTVFVLTAPSVEAKAARPVGFAEADGEPDPRAVATRSLEPELVEQLDLVVTRLNDQADLTALVRQGGMLADLARRYRARGLEITWDKTLVEWFRADHQQKRGKRDWEQWADHNLASALLPYLPARRPARPKRVVVKHEGDHLVIGAAQGRR